MANKKKKLKYGIPLTPFLLVKYNVIIGEYESSGHTVLHLKPRQKPEAQIHKYFLDFWGPADKGWIRCERYMYFDKAVKIRGYRYITKEQYDVLQEIGL